MAAINLNGKSTSTCHCCSFLFRGGRSAAVTWSVWAPHRGLWTGSLTFFRKGGHRTALARPTAHYALLWLRRVLQRRTPQGMSSPMIKAKSHDYKMRHMTKRLRHMLEPKSRDLLNQATCHTASHVTWHFSPLFTLLPRSLPSHPAKNKLPAALSCSEGRRKFLFVY